MVSNLPLLKLPPLTVPAQKGRDCFLQQSLDDTLAIGIDVHAYISLHLADESRPPPGRSDRVKSLCRGSAEGERKSLHARIEKLDLKVPISNGLRLADQLIQPLLGNRAVALLV